MVVVWAFELFCNFLLRWGDQFGISGNFRARMFWKAGRRDIVPLPQLYDYMSQEQPLGEYYPETPNWSSRSEGIVKILSPLITKDCSILEIGCNAGRNLNHLWQTGYTTLREMEISEHAVKRLRVAYPSLAAIPIDVGPAEHSIKKYESKSFDVIFTMSVLEHLHPDCVVPQRNRSSRKEICSRVRTEGREAFAHSIPLEHPAGIHCGCLDLHRCQAVEFCMGGRVDPGKRMGGGNACL